ncbi:MAG: penicillin-binding protein 2 [candidate division WOR-3 bacterium]
MPKRPFIVIRIFAITICITALLGHLFLVITKPEPYKTLAEKQHFLRINVPGKRGSIYDRFGRPLAYTGEGLALEVVDTLSLEDSLKLAKFGINLNRYELHQRVLGLSPFLWDKIGVKGVFKSIQYNRRYIPCGTPCKRLIGATNGIYGISGIEYGFDTILAPGIKNLVFIKHANGRIYPAPQDVFKFGDKNPDGRDIVLSIDMILQRKAYKVLQEWVDSLNAKGGMVIVANTKTGEILALTSVGSIYSDKMFLYEPGSTFKVVIYTEALERGLNIYDKCGENRGYIVIDGITINDVIPLGENDSWFWAVVKSSNACASKLALKMDSIAKGGLYRRALLYGFGEAADIGLYEDIPKLEKPSTWKRIKLANVAIGQGIQVNPIQMLRAYMVIANDGKYIYPTLLKTDTPRTNPARVVAKTETFHTLKRLLVAVVDSGTGRMAKINGIPIAGKTGTAQKIDPLTGKYSATKTLASFIGFFPAYSAKYIIYVLIDEPEIFRTGGMAAAPVFREVALEVLRLYEGWK